MKTDLSTAPVKDRYQHLLNLIGSQHFLDKQGLGNEVPFFICPFRPNEALEMGRMRKQLKNRLAQNGIEILDINLYDLVVKILKQEGDWDWCLEQEQAISKNELREELQSILDVETVLVPATNWK